MQISKHEHAHVHHLGLCTCVWTQRVKTLLTARTITLGSYRFRWIGGLAPRLGSYRFAWIGGLAPRHSFLGRNRFRWIGGLAPKKSLLHAVGV